ncbi:MAG: N-acetylmuramoyl-L-alanine amidase, partial [Gammaproteobacteria bacterium]
MKIAQRRLFLLVLCAAFVGTCPAAARSLARLQRLQLTAGTNRAVLYLSRPVPYHYFTLAHPARLVLDLGDTAPTHPHPKGLHGDGVAAVRFGVRHGYDLRIVFELQGSAVDAKVDAVRAGGRERLIIQLAPSRSSTHGHNSATRRTGSSHPAVRYQAVPRAGPMIVEIDPGHGGSDPGTTGPHGLHEKTVTLAIGRMVYRLLNDTPHVRAYLTRSGDYYVSLHKRVLQAQDHHADIYVSIHENAFPNDPQVRGGTCYALSRHGASDAEAAQLAQEENAADPQIAGVDFSHHSRTLNRVLTDLYQTSSIMAGNQLADDII